MSNNDNCSNYGNLVTVNFSNWLLKAMQQKCAILTHDFLFSNVNMTIILTFLLTESSLSSNVNIAKPNIPQTHISSARANRTLSQSNRQRSSSWR